MMNGRYTLLLLGSLVLSTSLPAAPVEGKQHEGGSMSALVQRHQDAVAANRERMEQERLAWLRAGKAAYIRSLVVGGTLNASIQVLVRNSHMIASEEVREFIRQLRTLGLEQDVQRPDYDLVEKGEVCEETLPDGTQKRVSISTAPGTPDEPNIGGRICVDDFMLADETPTDDMDAFLGALFLHDHIRHFGIDDDTHDLALKFMGEFRRFAHIRLVPDFSALALAAGQMPPAYLGRLGSLASRSDVHGTISKRLGTRLTVRIVLENPPSCPTKSDFRISVKHEVPYFYPSRRVRVGERYGIDLLDFRSSSHAQSSLFWISAIYDDTFEMPKWPECKVVLEVIDRWDVVVGRVHGESDGRLPAFRLSVD